MVNSSPLVVRNLALLLQFTVVDVRYKLLQPLCLNSLKKSKLDDEEPKSVSRSYVEYVWDTGDVHGKLDLIHLVADGRNDSHI